MINKLNPYGRAYTLRALWMFCVLDVLYLFGLCCCCLFLEASVYYQWIFLSFAIANFLKLRLSFAYRCCYSWVSIWLTHGQLTLMTSGCFRWPCKINKHCLSVWVAGEDDRCLHVALPATVFLKCKPNLSLREQPLLRVLEEQWTRIKRKRKYKFYLKTASKKTTNHIWTSCAEIKTTEKV